MDTMVMLRVLLHVAIFAAAFLTFTLGLGVGLVALVNVIWIVRGLRRRSGQGHHVDS